jgi:hypothetical protein
VHKAAGSLLPPSIRDVDGLEDDRTATISVLNGPPPEVLIAAKGPSANPRALCSFQYATHARQCTRTMHRPR